MIDLNFKVDMDGVAELAGTIAGLEDAWSDSDYLDALAHSAHDEATQDFDLAAAATARSGHISHMFEFGIPGVTRGSGGPPDPTSAAARLYQHRMFGHGGAYEVGFTFRPAVIPNPMPTTAHTGVASKYLRKISRRKYIFRQRAMVVETGQEVEIRPKRGNFLFVPFYGREPRDPRNTKGFMMWDASRHGPITSRPGINDAGTFTTFFEGWWRSNGVPQMEQSVARDIFSDTREALELAASRSKKSTLTPVSSSRDIISGTTARARRRAFETVKRKAMARRGMDRI